MALEFVLYGAAFVALAAIGAGGYYLWHERGRVAEEPAGEIESRHPPSSRYEQILAELQGIRLNFQSGEGRAGDGRKNYPKLARLVRVFLLKIGIADARDCPLGELELKMNGVGLSARQAQTLLSILQRCEIGEKQTNPLKNSVEPLELVRQFKAVLDQLEGRQPDRERPAETQ